MEENSGTRFGNYELVKRIDVGGMGEVYLAHQLTAFGRQVAIKIIRSDLVHDITARARFLREAEVSARLKHEHILPLFDFGEVEGRLFMVTPYIEGGTLAKRLKDSGPIPLEEVHRLFVPLVQAVAYVHRRGIIHRDLKPTNIMLDSEDGAVYVRLIDFGIASLQGQSASPPLTTAGHEMGTVAYMAPERLSGIAAPSNDIFSLGVILHQMLTARMPAATLSSNSGAPHLAEPLAQVVRRCIAANPTERYPTVEELLKDFEQVYQQIGQPAALGSRVPGIPALVSGRPDSDQHTLAAHSELVSLAHSGELPALPPRSSEAVAPRTARFAPEDYNAPTTSFQVPQQFRSPPPSRPPLIGPPQPGKPGARRKGSLLMIVSAASILILVVIAGMLYYGYQTVAAANVSVNFAPRSRVISQIFTIKADPAARTINIAQATIPAHVFTVSRTTQQSASTTGQVNCIFPGLGCQQAVSPDDVNALQAQMQPDLESSISRELQNKISDARGTQVGVVHFSVPVITPNPTVGTVSKIVTVTLAEQGSVGYFLNADTAELVQRMLIASAAQDYHIVDTSITIGQPAVQAVDPNSGVSSIQVPAGAVVIYQYTQAKLQALKTGLAGKSLTAARAFLLDQPGIDPASVSIHFTAGNGQSMPGDLQHITLIPLPPANLPGVSLTPVTGSTPITVPTPTVTPTVNDDGG
ncbi:MAG TPA: serine/threonine-protein kinase [Ktedonobacteraceae bacterium]|nr:serine/threonine-protein kinase [Ktedonobacteraceae bacterium]